MPAMGYNVYDLLQRGQQALDDCEPALAKKFFEKALELQPESAEIYEQLGAIALEMLRTSTTEEESFQMTMDAMAFYSKSIQLSPDSGYEKYLILAQLSHGQEALDLYKKGAALIEGKMSKDPTLIRKYASIMCSMTEIFMTDCCDHIDAETQCEQYMNKALSLDQNHPDVYQTLASVRLSQSRTQEAKVAVEKSMSIWLELDANDELWPSFANRTSLVKLLIELGLYDRALEILQLQQAEDDEDPEIWYLFGWCYYLIGGFGSNDAPALGSEAAEDASECLQTVLMLHDKFGTVQEDVLQHAKELLQIVDPQRLT